MKRIITILVLCILATFALTSCDDGGIEIPEDMQLVLENRNDGYIFFGPKGWILANQGDVAATFLSNFNKTSITFTPTDMPEDRGADGKVDLAAYFHRTMTEFPYEITISTDGESENFGTSDAGADTAKTFVYSYKVGEDSFTSKQILLTRGEDFYIFTYTAMGSAADESSDYRRYLDKANLVIKNFTFTDKSTASEDMSEVVRDGDGYILSSDKTISGFELYLPEDYTLTDKSTIVSAKITDGANITLTRATETGLGVLDYLLGRREALTAITENFTDIKIGVAKAVNTESDYFDEWPLDILPEYDSTLTFGDLTVKGNIVSYEYTYEHGGNKYHVYQVVGANNMYGYVFTYTALENEYSDHLEKIETILKKVKF